MTAVERYTSWAGAIGERAQQYALGDERFSEKAYWLAQEAAHCGSIAMFLAEGPDDTGGRSIAMLLERPE